VLGVSPYDEYDVELAKVTIADWLHHMAAHTAQLFVFDVTAHPAESADTADVSTAASPSSIAWARLIRELGCTSDVGCHAMQMSFKDTSREGPEARQGKGEFEAGREREILSSTFSNGELAFVYLSSSYRAQRGGAGGGEMKQESGGGEGGAGSNQSYTTLLESWLPKLRIGGFLAGKFWCVCSFVCVCICMVWVYVRARSWYTRCTPCAHACANV